MRRRLSDGEINEMAAKSRFMRALDEADAQLLLVKQTKRRPPGDAIACANSGNPLAPAGGAAVSTKGDV